MKTFIQLREELSKAKELQEYSMQQFGSDASDAARGFAKGITFGASDNIEAGAKSLFKGTSYKNELGKARQANSAAEKRSPKLFGAGEIAGSVAAPVPGASVIKGIHAASKIGKVAKIGGQLAGNVATQSAVNKVKSIAEPKTSSPKPKTSLPKPAQNVSTKPINKISPTIQKRAPKPMPIAKKF